MTKIFVTHNKCGTQWTTRIFREATSRQGVPFLSYQNGMDYSSLGAGLLFFRHYPGKRDDFDVKSSLFDKGVHVRRDPRDICVSALYSHAYTHAPGGWLNQHRQELLQLQNEDDRLLCVMEFCKPLIRYMADWVYGDQRFLEVKFEDIIADPKFWFGQMFEHFGWRIVPSFLPTFAQLSGGRDRGQEDTGHHYRKGVAGDWRSHFKDCHHEWMNENFPCVLERMGYA